MKQSKHRPNVFNSDPIGANMNVHQNRSGPLLVSDARHRCNEYKSWWQNVHPRVYARNVSEPFLLSVNGLH